MTAPAQYNLTPIVRQGRVRTRLRSLLADRRWHSTAELLTVAGSGVSSRLHELREGADGMPAVVVVCERRGRVFWYRLEGKWVPGANLDGGAAEAPRAVTP